MAKQRQRTKAGSAEAARVQAVMAAAFAALAEGKRAGALSQEGGGTIELKVNVGGTEVSLRVDGAGTSAWALAGTTMQQSMVLSFERVFILAGGLFLLVLPLLYFLRMPADARPTGGDVHMEM